MRISDWSSDVCSSDLEQRRNIVRDLADMRVGHREDDDIDIVERGLLVDARDPEFVLQTGPAGLAQLDVANVIFARLQIPRQACAHLSTRSEEHTSELQSLMRISYAVFCLKKKNNTPSYNLTHF